MYGGQSWLNGIWKEVYVPITARAEKKQKDRIWIMDVKKKHLYNFNRMYPAKTNKIETPLGFYLKNNENYPTSYEHKFAR